MACSFCFAESLFLPSFLPLSSPSLTVMGGMDPTGGAGIIRDERSCAAFAPTLRVQCVATALTRQGLGAPAACIYSHFGYLQQKLREDKAKVWKIGLVTQDAARALLLELKARGQHRPFLILDPVLAASQGGDMDVDLEGLYDLIPFCDVVTPNLQEAHQLVQGGSKPDLEPVSKGRTATDLTDLAKRGQRSGAPGSFPEAIPSQHAGDAGEWLVSLRDFSKAFSKQIKAIKSPGARVQGDGVSLQDLGRRSQYWLIKSFELGDTWVSDLVVVEGEAWRIQRARQPGPDPRGSGCALASAIACAWLLQTSGDAPKGQGAEVQGAVTGQKAAIPSKEFAPPSCSIARWDSGHWQQQTLEASPPARQRPLRAITRAITWLDQARQHLHPAPDGRFHLCFR